MRSRSGQHGEFLAKFRIFTKFAKSCLSFAITTVGIDRSREELSSGQVRVENDPLCQKLWSLKGRGWWAEFFENSKFHGTFETN